MKCFLPNLFLLLNLFLANAQNQPDFLKNHNEKWVDSIFQSMTTDQKIGQLLMPRGNFSGKPHDIRQLTEWVTTYKIGGLVFFAGSPARQAEVTNLLQEVSDIPLFIGQDFEWGTAMRLDSTVRFPYAMALGAIQGKEALIKEMGKSMGKHCNRLGVHINYAPVVDINNNPKNPVINFRSFGESKEKVYEKAKAIWQGMEEQKIITTAKHFPGHGDTHTDSHYDLPLIEKSTLELEGNELYPFQKLIDDGLPGIMTAHIQVPALDDAAYMPATLSRKTITGLLRKKLGFQGLVFTDAMDMSGIVKYYSQGEAIVMALIAGNDIIETFTDVPVAVDAIRKAMNDGRLTQEWLDSKVKKILKAKSWVGLDHYKPVPLKNLVTELTDLESEIYNEALAAASVTLVKNKNKFLPVTDFSKKTALISIGTKGQNHLLEMIHQYGNADHFFISKEAADTVNVQLLKQSLSRYDVILVAFFSQQIRPAQKYGTTPNLVFLINELGEMQNNVLIWMANVYGLNQVSFDKYRAVLCGYQDTKFVQKVMGQAVFGACDIQGVLPVTLNPEYKSGAGNTLLKRQVPGFVQDYTHIKKYILIKEKTDSMMNIALQNGYFPGAVLQVIHKGNTLIQESYGNKTYSKQPIKKTSVSDSDQKNDVMDQATSGTVSGQKVTDFGKDADEILEITDIYDYASVTKIAATGLAVMKWVDEGLLDIDAPMYTYFPEYKDKPMASATFRNLLTHRAGLEPWIPFWKTTIDSVKTLENIMISHPEILPFYSTTEKKPFFLARWFGKKPKKVIDLNKSVSEHKPELWNKIFETGILVKKVGFYSKQKNEKFSVFLSDSLWLREDYKDEIFRQILKAPLGPVGKYVYSDLHFYFYPELCKRLTGQEFDVYLEKIYSSLGMNSMGFHPLQKFSKKHVVPTESDMFFRKDLIHGTVHDEGAIMMGGVSGHAGLFGNVNDLSKLMYMYLSAGKYNGQQIVSEKTVKQFTSYQFLSENNRRGLVFDKKDPSGQVRNAPALSSESSFGHSGFTGTYVWVDPQYELVITFLSNRVHPDRKNNKINENLFRQKLCDEIYKVVLEDY